MLTQTELESRVERNALICLESSTQIMEDKAIELTTLDDLFAFAKRNNVSSLFYYYTYVSEDNLIIDEEVLAELEINDSATMEVLSDKIEEYNVAVHNLDFEKPIALYVFCLSQGFIVYYNESDFWFVDEGFGMPKAKAIEMATELLDEICDRKESRRAEVFKKREQLKLQILNDPEFHRCTNKTLRNAYSRKLFENDPEINSLFCDENRRFYDIPSYVFFEQIWKEYKESR